MNNNPNSLDPDAKPFSPDYAAAPRRGGGGGGGGYPASNYQNPNYGGYNSNYGGPPQQGGYNQGGMPGGNRQQRPYHGNNYDPNYMSMQGPMGGGYPQQNRPRGGGMHYQNRNNNMSPGQPMPMGPPGSQQQQRMQQQQQQHLQRQQDVHYKQHQQQQQQQMAGPRMPMGQHPQQRGPGIATPPVTMSRPVTPRVILVTGYRRTGKTSVAKELAKTKQYQYVSLRRPVEEDDGSASRWLEPLAALLSSKRDTLQGIVIDDALVHSRYEPYYVNHLLEEKGLAINTLVIITTELSDLVDRKVEFDLWSEKKEHPESFEFAAAVEDANNSPDGSAIAVVDGTQPLADVVREAVAEVQKLQQRNLPPLRLPQINFIDNCPLVTDPAIVEEVIDAEATSLHLKSLPYGFSYVEPNYILDYVQFVKHALCFKSYLLVPWIWGDKVSLVAYKDAVYVHLPSYNVLFELRDKSTPLLELLTRLRGEVQAQEEEEKSAGNSNVLFSLEAAMRDGVIYISDMMKMGTKLGSRMVLSARANLMSELLSKLPSSGPLQLLRHYPVNKIAACLNDYAHIARGALFINPDGMRAGKYDSRNFIYPGEREKTVQVRLWGGVEVGDGDVWSFDAFVRDDGEEMAIAPEEVKIPVLIPSGDVEKYAINDGHIVECVLTQKPSADDAAAQKKNSGQQQQQQQQQQEQEQFFAFRRRCNFQSQPTTLFYQSAFSHEPRWPTELLFKACEAIKYFDAAELVK